jgi:hypothetical protein
MEQKINIQEAAKRLSRELTGRVDHVVGVSLRRPNLGVGGLALYVDIDADRTPPEIPSTFLGYPVLIRRIGTPIFAIW